MGTKKKPLNLVAQIPVFVLNVLNIGSLEEPRVLLSGLVEAGFIIISEFWRYFIYYRIWTLFSWKYIHKVQEAVGREKKEKEEKNRPGEKMWTYSN